MSTTASSTVLDLENSKRQISKIKIENETEGFECFPLDSCFFLVACHATLHPAMSVGRSVGRLVGLFPFYFFGVFVLFEHTAPA